MTVAKTEEGKREHPTCFPSLRENTEFLWANGKTQKVTRLKLSLIT